MHHGYASSKEHYHLAVPYFTSNFPPHSFPPSLFSSLFPSLPLHPYPLSWIFPLQKAAGANDWEAAAPRSEIRHGCGGKCPLPLSIPLTPLSFSPLSFPPSSHLTLFLTSHSPHLNPLPTLSHLHTLTGEPSFSPLPSSPWFLFPRSPGGPLHLPRPAQDWLQTRCKKLDFNEEAFFPFEHFYISSHPMQIIFLKLVIISTVGRCTYARTTNESSIVITEPFSARIGSAIAPQPPHFLRLWK